MQTGFEVTHKMNLSAYQGWKSNISHNNKSNILILMFQVHNNRKKRAVKGHLAETNYKHYLKKHPKKILSLTPLIILPPKGIYSSFFVILLVCEILDTACFTGYLWLYNGQWMK